MWHHRTTVLAAVAVLALASCSDAPSATPVDATLTGPDLFSGTPYTADDVLGFVPDLPDYPWIEQEVAVSASDQWDHVSDALPAERFVPPECRVISHEFALVSADDAGAAGEDTIVSVGSGGREVDSAVGMSVRVFPDPVAAEEFLSAVEATAGDCTTGYTTRNAISTWEIGSVDVDALELGDHGAVLRAVEHDIVFIHGPEPSLETVDRYASHLYRHGNLVALIVHVGDADELPRAVLTELIGQFVDFLG